MALTDKERAKRYRDRKKAIAQAIEEWGPIPDHIKKHMEKYPEMKHIEYQLGPAERAPVHMRESVEGDWVLIGVDELSASATAARKHEALERTNELKRVHADIWGQRGAPRKIASREKRRDPETDLTIRTIQRYFRKDKASSPK